MIARSAHPPPAIPPRQNATRTDRHVWVRNGGLLLVAVGTRRRTTSQTRHAFAVIEVTMFDRAANLERPIAEGQRKRKPTTTAPLHAVDHGPGLVNDPPLGWLIVRVRWCRESWRWYRAAPS